MRDLKNANANDLFVATKNRCPCTHYIFVRVSQSAQIADRQKRTICWHYRIPQFFGKIAEPTEYFTRNDCIKRIAAGRFAIHFTIVITSWQKYLNPLMYIRDMFPVSTSIMAICILLTLLVYGLAVTLLHGYKSRISVNILAILLMLWIIFQSTLALNGWYMNYHTALPHWLFACFVPWAFAFLLFRKTYHFELPLQSLFLHVLVASRAGIALNLWQLSNASQLPKQMVSIAIGIELIWGISGIILAIPSIRKTIPSSIKKWWHHTGFATALILCILSLLAAPGKWQLWSFDRPNYAFMHFPFVWLPSVVWPLCAWAHQVLSKKPIPTSVS